MRARVFAVHIHSVNHITARSGTPTSRVSKQSLRRCQQTADGYRLTVGRRASEPPDLSHLQIVAEVVAGHRIIRQMENGTIVVLVDGVRVPKAKPILREVAAPLGIPLINGVGGVKNTRQLGAEIIANLRA
jgi:hypothetical protein